MCLRAAAARRSHSKRRCEREANSIAIHTRSSQSPKDESNLNGSLRVCAIAVARGTQVVGVSSGASSAQMNWRQLEFARVASAPTTTQIENENEHDEESKSESERETWRKQNNSCQAARNELPLAATAPPAARWSPEEVHFARLN